MPRAIRSPELHGRRAVLGALVALAAGAASLPATAAELPILRVGTLAFGTADWEVDVIRRNRLDEKHGFRLVTLKLADKDAASIALLSGGVDVIVSDWLWVSHQRQRGGDVCFVAHSLAVGGLMVPPGSPLRGVADLRGRRIGIGGGPDDKSWLLLQAYARKSAGIDLAQTADINFSAPPLLNHLALAGKLDAVLNFWQFDARLSVAGFHELLPINAILPALGIDRPPPLLGWVFHQQWGEAHPALIEGFLAASAEAKRRLRSSDDEWTMLRPLMGAGGDDKLFAALRDSYRQGIPAPAGAADAEAARRAFAVMIETAGPGIDGGDTALAEGTFWPGGGR